MEIRTINQAMLQSGTRPMADGGQILQPVRKAEQVTVEAVTQPSRSEASSAGPDAPPREVMARIAESLELLSKSSNLQFAVDDELGRVVIKVIDAETKEVIKQFPSEDALELAKSLVTMSGSLMKAKA